eukprot:SAG11_NODE_7_length_31267_cov_19.541966_15_plen_299_part_00
MKLIFMFMLPLALAMDNERPYGVMGVNSDCEDDLGNFDTKEAAEDLFDSVVDEGDYNHVIIFDTDGYNPEYENVGNVRILREWQRPVPPAQPDDPAAAAAAPSEAAIVERARREAELEVMAVTLGYPVANTGDETPAEVVQDWTRRRWQWSQNIAAAESADDEPAVATVPAAPEPQPTAEPQPEGDIDVQIRAAQRLVDLKEVQKKIAAMEYILEFEEDEDILNDLTVLYCDELQLLGDDCPICLSPLAEGVVTTSCGHQYHFDCLRHTYSTRRVESSYSSHMENFQTWSQCPMCRQR